MVAAREKGITSVSSKAIHPGPQKTQHSRIDVAKDRISQTKREARPRSQEHMYRHICNITEERIALFPIRFSFRKYVE